MKLLNCANFIFLCFIKFVLIFGANLRLEFPVTGVSPYPYKSPYDSAASNPGSDYLNRRGVDIDTKERSTRFRESASKVAAKAAASAV